MELLRELFVDFNAQTADGKVRLDTVGGLESVARTGVKPGDHVVLTDGEVRAKGVVLEGLLAEVEWDTARDVEAITLDDVGDLGDLLKL